MKSYVSPLTLGRLSLSSNVFYSSLAGHTDFPFRRIITKYRPGLFFCEVVKMDALVRYKTETFRLLDYSADMHPIGAQIFGCKPGISGQAARIIEDLGFDLIDFNCGCPVDKVVKDGSGSAMLKNPELIGEIIAKIVSSVRIPVILKVRAGWDEEHINSPEITRIAERAGASAITVHGRTREQGYRGHANREIIKACKGEARSIKVIGNGDIFDAEAGLSMFAQTGCDAVLVSRGILGQPWIAQNIYRKDRGEDLWYPTIEERKSALFEFFAYLCEYYPESKVVARARNAGCWYFKKQEKTFYHALCKVSTIDEMREIFEQ